MQEYEKLSNKFCGFWSHTVHTSFTLTKSFPPAFTLLLSPAETVYPIVKMFQVINKKARATFLFFMVKFWHVWKLTLRQLTRKFRLGYLSRLLFKLAKFLESFKGKASIHNKRKSFWIIRDVQKTEWNINHWLFLQNTLY